MHKLLLVSCLLVFSLGAQAQEDARTVKDFIGSSVQLFDEQLKPLRKVSSGELSGVTSATKNGATPFYRIERDGEVFFVLGSKIVFDDRPRTDMIPCNTRSGDFEVATFNSTMGSGEKKACSE